MISHCHVHNLLNTPGLELTYFLSFFTFSISAGSFSAKVSLRD